MFCFHNKYYIKFDNIFQEKLLKYKIIIFINNNIEMSYKTNKLSRVIKYIFISFSFIFLMLFCVFHFGFLNNFSSVKFDKTKLSYTNSEIKLFDDEGLLINQNKEEEKDIIIKDLPKNLINAFISIEDKSFYSHNGINYKRMIMATIKNITSGKLKEGASTISQQLIKNTHLTNEKTFSRKANELLLAKELEKQLSKDEILTAYFNAIYFGSGAFGINQASQRFFSKEPKDLNLAECATLAAIIKSPKTYSPINNKDKCKKRRNLVLKEMYKDNKINKEELTNALNLDIGIKINTNYLKNNTYLDATINEACSILKITEKDLLLKEYKIYTYKNQKIQSTLENEIKNYLKYTNNEECDCAAMSVDNKTGGINGFYGKSIYDLYSLKRQPGSAFKPIISYAPAIENNIIYPITPILDEKVNINGYIPTNYNNKNYGWISAKTALAKSLNIPSVKVLNYVGIAQAKEFAKKLGVNFNNKDNGYSLALGGLTDGLTIKELTNCYQCFGNNGKFIPLGLIKEIRNKNDKIIYKHNTFGKKAIKDSTAFLITDMLKESVKSGTCKKLNLTNYNIAAKTGTVGIPKNKDKENSDAWNISYTPDNTLCVWFGSTNINNGLSKNISGSTAPSLLAQAFYKNNSFLKNKDFEKPNSVEEIDLNNIEYTNNQKILLADQETPDRYKFKSYFSIDNKPEETSNIFNKIDDFEIKAKVIDNYIEILLDANKYLWYEIIKINEDNKEIIATIKDKQGEIFIKDNNVKKGNFYSYYVVAHFNNFTSSNIQKEKNSNIIKLFLA